jgi:hypothetical protein
MARSVENFQFEEGKRPPAGLNFFRQAADILRCDVSPVRRFAGPTLRTRKNDWPSQTCPAKVHNYVKSLQ